MNLRKEIRNTIREQAVGRVPDYDAVQEMVQQIKDGLDRFSGLLPKDFDSIPAKNYKILQTLRQIHRSVSEIVETVDT